MKRGQETYRDIGMSDYASKPATPNALSEAIQRQAGGAPIKKDNQTSPRINSKSVTNFKGPNSLPFRKSGRLAEVSGHSTDRNLLAISSARR
jgi:DNA-binding NarL/FixJ family response regulator